MIMIHVCSPLILQPWALLKLRTIREITLAVQESVAAAPALLMTNRHARQPLTSRQFAQSLDVITRPLGVLCVLAHTRLAIFDARLQFRKVPVMFVGLSTPETWCRKTAARYGSIHVIPLCARPIILAKAIFDTTVTRQDGWQVLQVICARRAATFRCY